MILSGFRKCHEKTNTSLYVGIYYLQWRLVELPTSITRRLIAVYIYDAHSSPKIQNSFHGVIHSRRIAYAIVFNNGSGVSQVDGLLFLIFDIPIYRCTIVT
ncbi:MAG: hypothetical protein HOB58_03050 [Nitrospina sp.]|nr:hypothetical protein [Nitrospina sp.]